MARSILFFNGRNVMGISNDAFQAGLMDGRDPVVITMDDEQIPPPYGVEAVKVSDFIPEAGDDYLVIANGGGTSQAVATYSLIAAHARGEIKLEIVNLQRDEGPVTIWPPTQK